MTSETDKPDGNEHEAGAVREALYRVTLETTRPFVIMIAGVFMAALLVHYFNLLGLPTDVILPLLILDAVALVVAGLLWMLLQREMIPLRWVDAVGLAMALLGASIPLLSMLWIGDPLYSIFVLVILFGVGSLTLSTTWVLLTIGAVIAGWAIVAALALERHEVFVNGFAVAVSSGLAVAIHGNRKRLHVQIEKLGLRDRKRAADLTEALQVAGRELDERQRAEEALKASEERYRTLIESQGEGVGISDTEENIVFANPAAEEIFGVAPGGLAGRSLREFLEDEEWRRVISETETRREGERSTYQLEIVRSDGEHRIVLVTATPRHDDDGTYAGAFGVFRDLTDYKQAEDERAKLETKLQQAQKLESLGVMAGGIAHDFNNLLMGIIGNTEFALAAVPADAKVRKDLEEVIEASNRAAGLCRQMLAYSGRGTLAKETLDLSRLVAESLPLLEASLSIKAELKLNLGGNLPRVECDRSQIGQVVMNLISNASEALGDDIGLITISTDTVTVDEGYQPRSYLDEDLVAGLYVRLTVADTGSGMDEATRERVFDPFFTTKFTGRGLGMAAVLGIVRGHRGAIELHSTAGEGTTFTVLLPASESVSIDEAETKSPADEAWRGSGTVLIADDEAVVCRVGKRMLEEIGFEVLTASDGQEAVDLFRAQADRIDLVLLDLTMPRLTGDEAFREIRGIRADARVMLSSGYSEEEIDEQLTVEGLAGFVQKPYRLETLRAKLREVLE